MDSRVFMGRSYWDMCSLCNDDHEGECGYREILHAYRIWQMPTIKYVMIFHVMCFSSTLLPMYAHTH